MEKEKDKTKQGGKAKKKESEDSRRGKILSKLFNLPDGILETMQVLANFSSGHLL